MDGPEPTPRAPARPEPLRFGGWTTSLPISVTGGSIVYAADGPDGPAAIKVPRVGEPGGRARADHAAIAREARLLRACAHPHVVRLLDEGEGWLATERVPGEPWSTWAAHRSADASIGVAIEVASALQAIHAAGVAHGDLKPTNVLVDDWGHARLLDLGAAAALGEPWTQASTAGFTAPELLGGARAAPSADVYGFGATLYAALSGRAPFDTADPKAQAHLVTHSAPIPVSAWRADVPDRVNRMVNAALARDPARRPDLDQIVRELRDAHRSAPARPVLGMTGSRLALHREVCRAASGRPVVIHIYGPPGTGRRTLVTEALRLARREGMPVFERPDPIAFLAAFNAGERPAAVLRARATGTREAALRVLRGKGAGLLLTWDTRPAPDLVTEGAIELSPEPLDLHAARALAAALGAPPVAADDAWRRTGGHPLQLWHALGRCAADRLLAPPELGKEARRVLDAARATRGTHGLTALARALNLHPLALLEEALVLEAAGLIGFSDDGQTLRAIAPKPDEPDRGVTFTAEARAAARAQRDRSHG